MRRGCSIPIHHESMPSMKEAKKESLHSQPCGSDSYPMLDFSRALTQVRDICPKVPHLWDFSNRKSRTCGTFQIESPAPMGHLPQSPAPMGLFKSKVPHRWDFSNRKSRTCRQIILPSGLDDVWDFSNRKSRTCGTFQIESPALVDRLFSPHGLDDVWHI